MRFAPGETVKTVAVATLGDSDAEPAETLTLRLSNAEGATLATAEASGTIAASGGADTFTGTFSGVPPEHDGETEFELTLTFDEEPEGLSYKTVKDDLFAAQGGTIGGARRASAPSNRAFVLKVTPGGNEAVKLTLNAVPPCGQDKTVCSAGGAVLSGPLGVTVPGPAALSVADATVQEGPGAVLEFVVSLDRERHAPVTRRLRDRGRHGRGGRGLHRGLGRARLRGRRDGEDGLGAGARRRPRRGLGDA